MKINLPQTFEQLIAQFWRLRTGLWPEGASYDLPHWRPAPRLQHLNWTDPKLHRARVRWAHEECEWKAGETTAIVAEDHSFDQEIAVRYSPPATGPPR